MFKLPAFLAIGLFAAQLAFAGPTPALSDKELISTLQRGGCVLAIRHPKTNADQADTDPLHLENVAAQRQLSEEGRQIARDLGETFRALKIPVAKVITSKFQRAVDAGTLLGIGEVEPSVDVSEGGLVVTPRENQRRAKALRDLLSTPPPEGKNVVIVSHKPNIEDAAGKEFGDLSEGEVVIFQPLKESGFKVLARVAAAKWIALAKSPL